LYSWRRLNGLRLGSILLARRRPMAGAGAVRVSWPARRSLSGQR